MINIVSGQSMPILATYNPLGSISIKASAISEDLGKAFHTHIVEQKDPRFVYAIARAVTADIPNKNHDMFPLDEIKRAYTSFIGRNIFLDHNTTSVRNAVGKIIAAEVREDEDSQVYVACLFKIDRELHPDIAHKIENGIIDSVSMGANVEQSECSVCHHFASRQADFCNHQNNPHMYYNYYSINHGVEFTELSLVSVPADPVAKMHKVFNLQNGIEKVAIGADDVDQIAESEPAIQQEHINAVEKEEATDPILQSEGPAKDTRVLQTEAPVSAPSLYQIDCSSNETADLIYNLLYPFINKGIEEITITGRGIRVQFEDFVEDPEEFINEAAVMFGLTVDRGIAEERTAAAFKRYLTKTAASLAGSTKLGSISVDGHTYDVFLKGSIDNATKKTKLLIFVTNPTDEDSFVGKDSRGLISNRIRAALEGTGLFERVVPAGKSSNELRFSTSTKESFGSKASNAAKAAKNVEFKNSVLNAIENGFNPKREQKQETFSRIREVLLNMHYLDADVLSDPNKFAKALIEGLKELNVTNLQEAISAGKVGIDTMNEDAYDVAQRLALVEDAKSSKDTVPESAPEKEVSKEEPEAKEPEAKGPEVTKTIVEELKSKLPDVKVPEDVITSDIPAYRLAKVFFDKYGYTDENADFLSFQIAVPSIIISKIKENFSDKFKEAKEEPAQDATLTEKDSEKAKRVIEDAVDSTAEKAQQLSNDSIVNTAGEFSISDVKIDDIDPVELKSKIDAVLQGPLPKDLVKRISIFLKKKASFFKFDAQESGAKLSLKLTDVAAPESHIDVIITKAGANSYKYIAKLQRNGTTLDADGTAATPGTAINDVSELLYSRYQDNNNKKEETPIEDGASDKQPSEHGNTYEQTREFGLLKKPGMPH